METLVFFSATEATALSAVDLGAVAPRSSDDTALRVHNTSDLYQAQDVTVTVSGSDADQLWLSLDGDVYTASVDLGDIPPGAGSPVFWLRRVTAHDTPTGACAGQVAAAPAAWTSTVDTSTTANVPLDTEES